MTDSSTPRNSDEDPPRPRLSLKRRNRPQDVDPSENAPEKSSAEDLAGASGSAETGEEEKRPRPGPKLSLKNPRRRPSEETDSPASSERANDPQATARPLDDTRPEKLRLRQAGEPAESEQTGAAEVEERSEPPAARRPKVGLRLKDGSNAAQPSWPGLPEEEPADEPGSTRHVAEGDEPDEPEVRVDDSSAPESDSPPDPDANSGSRLLLADLPFELPDRVGDDPPPLPQVEVKPGTRKAVTFDDLEPAHSDKPPPPSDAPVFKGKTRRRRSKFGKVVVGLLVCAFLLSGLLFIRVILQDSAPPAEAEVAVEEQGAEAGETETGAGDAAAQSPLAAPEEAVAAEAVAIPPQEGRAEADPVIAAIVDHLTITIARPHSESPVIIVDGVAYEPGAIIDPESGIRFIGFVMERREAVFEDYRGARYFRYF